MDYRKDVLDDALDFIRDHEDLFLEALRDGHDSLHDFSIDDRGEFHESVTDRSYTLADAAYILENCDNEETDSGLWSSLDPKEAVPVMAAYSYANDVRERLGELYEELHERYTELTEELEAVDAKIPDTDDDSHPAKRALADILEAHRPKPVEVEPKSDEERVLLSRWLIANAKVGMRGGYPLGSSYIDSRCGTGHGMPEEKDYVEIDHEVASRCPHMRGASRDQVEAYLKKGVLPKRK
jgi:hypothetical protein